MVSTVGTRPNHYAVLGLTPGASGEEIEQAFTREIGRPRAFGGIAEVSIAYQTLRNPERRRAYDAALGLAPEPEPEPHVEPARGGPVPFLIAAARAKPRPAAPPPAPPREPPSAPWTTPFLAARLEALAAKAPLPRPVAAATPAPEPEPEPLVEFDEPPAEDAEGLGQWKRVGIAAGGAVVAIGLLAGWAGWNRGDGLKAEQQQAEQAALLAPPPTTFALDSDPPPPPARVVRTAKAAPKRAVAARVERRRPAATGLADLERQLAEPQAVDPVEPAQAAPDAAAAPARMPLSNATIARTIGRIGYACGAVASTTAGDAPGAFTVTCTSGHRYRAAPVHGRYRFKRL